MNTIHYSIQFFGYWHIGSGLSGGTKADSLVLKDVNNLPYIPGKTLKGLFRHACEELGSLSTSYLEKVDPEKAFGSSGTRSENISSLFFSDAQLGCADSSRIVSEELSESLYTVISSTKINEFGVAEDKSLRQIEVVVPLTLFGSIRDFSETHHELVKTAPMIKYVGLNRNRGLGRCEIKIIQL